MAFEGRGYQLATVDDSKGDDDMKCREPAHYVHQRTPTILVLYIFINTTQFMSASMTLPSMLKECYRVIVQWFINLITSK